MPLKHNVLITILLCCIVSLSAVPKSGAGDIDLESINFAFDSNEAIEDLKQLQRLSDLMSLDDELILEISAHTDTTGSEAYNTNLSQKRAAAVKQLLAQRGLAPERILIRANAFHTPLASNKNLEGRLLNRRTDFSVFKMVNGERDYYYMDNLFIKPLPGKETPDGKKNDIAEKDDGLDRVMDRIDELEALLKEKNTTPTPAAEASPSSTGGQTNIPIYAGNHFALSGGVGASNGELLGNIQGRLFFPMRDDTFALQGGFNADITEDLQEYQMDAGLLGRSGPYQLGCFASFKLVNMDMYRDTALLSQIQLSASRMFQRGSVGLFFTDAIQDEDVLESNSHYEFADLYTTETYLKVSDKIGFNVAYQFENGLWVYGDIGSQNADDMDLFGSFRASWPLTETGEWRLICQADYNNGYLEKEDNYSGFIGIELSSPTPPNTGTPVESIRPMVVQDISYQVKTRTTALLSQVNHAPDVSIQVTTIQGAPPLEVSFTAIASDPDGTIASYAWDFGDGQNGEGEHVTHTYSVSGLYNVALMVTDNKGAVSSASTTIDVINSAPKVTLHTTALKGEYPHSVTFTASASDPGGTISAYEWQFGDNKSATGEIVTHTFTSPGTYPVVLTVRDNLMRITTATAMVTVLPKPIFYPPVADIQFSLSPTNPTTVRFNGDGWDPDGQIKSFSWNLGDGSLTNLQFFEHTYTRSGSYMVTLIVTDSQGLADKKAIMVTVP